MASVLEVHKRNPGRSNDEMKHRFMNDRGCGDDSISSDYSKTYSLSSDVGRSPVSPSYRPETRGDNPFLDNCDSYLNNNSFNFDIASSGVSDSSANFSLLPVGSDYHSEPYSQPNNNLSSLSFSSYNQNSTNDRTRRYGHRFETPILYQLQMDSELRSDLGLDYARQASAPNLSGEYEMEPPIRIPSSRFDGNLLYPGYRYSTPLVYSSDRLGSPTSGPLTDETHSQSSATPPLTGKISEPLDREGKHLLGRFGLRLPFLSGSRFISNDPKPNIMNLPPGENNPDATPGANLCYDFLNKGVCERQKNGDVCHYRHLDPNHPDAIADRFKNNLLSPEEIAKYRLRKCEPDEVNPFAPANAKICYDFLNKRVCSRTMEMKICRYRHLLPNHPDAKADRERSSKRKLIHFGRV